MGICRNCDRFVSEQFIRVMEPQAIAEQGEARACPQCEDLVRAGADVREARSNAGRGNDGGKA